MGRDREYKSDADRQRAYRQRKARFLRWRTRRTRDRH